MAKLKNLENKVDLIHYKIKKADEDNFNKDLENNYLKEQRKMHLIPH